MHTADCGGALSFPRKQYDGYVRVQIGKTGGIGSCCLRSWSSHHQRDAASRLVGSLYGQGLTRCVDTHRIVDSF